MEGQLPVSHQSLAHCHLLGRTDVSKVYEGEPWWLTSQAPGSPYPKGSGQPELTTGCHYVHERATQTVLGHQGSPYKQVLRCLPISALYQHCQGHTAHSEEPEAALWPPDFLPCAPWGNSLLAAHSVPCRLFLGPQKFCLRRTNGVCRASAQKVRGAFEASLVWGIANRLEHKQFHMSHRLISHTEMGRERS